MKNRIISQLDALAAARIAKGRIVEWNKRGIVGRPPYSLAEVVGLAISAWLRDRDVGVSVVEKLMDWFGKVGDEKLAAHLEAGEHILVIELVSGRLFLCRDDAEFRINSQAQFLMIDLAGAHKRVSDFLTGLDEGFAACDAESN